MKKFFSILTGQLFILVFIATSVFATDTTRIGTLMSIDKAKGTLVFRTADTKEQITLKADKNILKNFQEKDKISVTYDNGKARMMTKVRTRSGVKVHAAR